MLLNTRPIIRGSQKKFISTIEFIQNIQITSAGVALDQEIKAAKGEADHCTKDVCKAFLPLGI